MIEPRAAPAIAIGAWVQGEPKEGLGAAMAGRVLLLHAFQTLCPGCVRYGVPQAERVHRAVVGAGGALAGAPLWVLGIHTPFDPSEPKDPAAVARFARDQGLEHALCVDRGQETLAAFGLAGTPSLCLIDRAGRLRRRHLGPMADLDLGVELGVLLSEPGPP